MTHIYWVTRQQKIETPNEKDEVKKVEVHEYDGWTRDPDAMVDPPTPKSQHKPKTSSWYRRPLSQVVKKTLDCGSDMDNCLLFSSLWIKKVRVTYKTCKLCLLLFLFIMNRENERWRYDLWMRVVEMRYLKLELRNLHDSHTLDSYRQNLCMSVGVMKDRKD